MRKKEGGDTTDYYEMLKRVESYSPVEVDRSVYSLTPEELEGLRKEVELETDPAFVFKVIDILFEILALEKSPEPYRNATHVLQKLLDALIILGKFQKASDLLSRVNIILKTYELQEWQVKIIQRINEEAGELKPIEEIRKILDKGEEIQLEEARHYLTLLQPNAIQPLIKVLGELNNSKARRMLCEVLIAIGKGNLELITPFIDDQRWYLVRNVTYILGRIGKEATLPAIQKALNHSEARVRREAIQALGLIGGSKGFELMGKTLRDEDFRNRSIAALNLARVGEKPAFRHSWKWFTRKIFPKGIRRKLKPSLMPLG